MPSPKVDDIAVSLRELLRTATAYKGPAGFEVELLNKRTDLERLRT